jgi:MSHA biogenesis protein MshO
MRRLSSKACISHRPSSGDIGEANRAYLPNKATLQKTKGFTLIELVLVIVVLGIVSISISGIMRGAVNAVVTVSEREDLVREGSYLVERFNRELSNAVPNSVRISGNAFVHCLEFVPLKWSTIYLTLPLVSQATTQANVIELSDIQGRAYSPQTSDFGIVFPTQSDDVYTANIDKRQAIVSCSDDGDGDCDTIDDNDQVIQINFADGFAATSPSRRMYFASDAVSYCVRDQQVFRYSGAIQPSQTLYTTGGVLMAQNLVNQLGASASAGEQNPFSSIGASVQRNAYTRTLFIFGRESDDNEKVTFMQEVQIPNAP